MFVQNIQHYMGKNNLEQLSTRKILRTVFRITDSVSLYWKAMVGCQRLYPSTLSSIS